MKHLLIALVVTAGLLTAQEARANGNVGFGIGFSVGLNFSAGCNNGQCYPGSSGLMSPMYMQSMMYQQMMYQMMYQQMMYQQMMYQRMMYQMMPPQGCTGYGYGAPMPGYAYGGGGYADQYAGYNGSEGIPSSGMPASVSAGAVAKGR